MRNETVEDYQKKISIKFLKEYGYLDKNVRYKTGTMSWIKNGEKIGDIGVEVKKGEEQGFVRVYFSQTNNDTGEKRYLDYQIPLVTTKCNYGGVRWWFLCPCESNRCNILYLQSNGIFASRKTLNLAYEEQNKSRLWREMNHIFPRDYEAEEVYKTIKYKYRNGKATRKYRKYLRLSKDYIPLREHNDLINSYLLR